jgi:hypothetical protein
VPRRGVEDEWAYPRDLKEDIDDAGTLFNGSSLKWTPSLATR